MLDFLHAQWLIRVGVTLGIVVAGLVLTGVYFARKGSQQPVKQQPFVPVTTGPKVPQPYVSTIEQKLDGTWRVESVTRDPRDKEPDPMRGARITVKGAQVEAKLPDGKASPMKLTISVDNNTKPRTADITRGEDEEAIPAIYEIDGETLRVCFGPAGKERPKAFKSDPGSGHSLVVFKREWVWNVTPEKKEKE